MSPTAEPAAAYPAVPPFPPPYPEAYALPPPGRFSRFVLTLCNRTDTDATPPSVAFSYIIFDLP